MTPRVAWRQAVRTVLAAVLPLAVAACTGPPTTPTAAPSPRPSGVVVDPSFTAAPSPRPSGVADPRCRIRGSYPSSGDRPERLLNAEDRPKELRDKLVVGVDPSDATMSHWNATRFEGFNIDLVKAVVAELWPGEDPLSHVVFRVVPPGENSFGHLKPPTAKEGVDMIATSLTATCARAEKVIFSDNYLDSGQTVLVRVREDKGDPEPEGEKELEFKGIEDLGGR